jgi:alpha-maltose-1-phosphate synthase
VSDEARTTVLLSFPFANENVRADLLALQRAGMLSLFCTTIAWRQGRGLHGVLPSAIRLELERRIFDGVEPALIKTFPLRDLIRQAARRLGLKALTRHETGWASVDGVIRAFDAQVARLICSGRVDASAIYAYEYSALRSFEAAGSAGIRRFYELPIGYWRAGLRILTEERERKPEWSPTIELLLDSAEKHERKDAETAAADHIIVPSDFVRDTLREHPGFAATIDILPYGAPAPKLSSSVLRPRLPKLRLLYVGHLSQRKGISYLFDAMHRLGSAATLTLVGPKSGDDCPALEGELKRHTWFGSMPHERVLEVMAEHDVLVFPSLFEGFGLVILEAMAQGVPVITTTNTGGPHVIEEGVDGFVVPIRDSDAIVERVLELQGDRDRLVSMSLAALRKAEQLSWPARGIRMIDILRARSVASERSVTERLRNRA